MASKTSQICLLDTKDLLSMNHSHKVPGTIGSWNVVHFGALLEKVFSTVRMKLIHVSGTGTHVPRTRNVALYHVPGDCGMNTRTRGLSGVLSYLAKPKFGHIKFAIIC
jgi:hypothetical protein